MATWTVDANGTGDFSTIQEAIDAAVSGDTIEVVAAEYVEAIDFSGKDVEVRSLSGSGSTRIVWSGAAEHPVSVVSGEGAGAKLIGFTVTNPTGTAVHVEGADPTFEDLVLEGSGSGAEYGAAMIVSGGHVTLADSVVRGNLAYQGAIYVTLDATLGITDTTFEENEAQSGGAMFVDRGEVTLDGVTMSRNYAPYGPGGAYVQSPSRLVSNGTIWESNRSETGDGASLHVRGEARLEDDTFTDSYATFSSSGTWGGAVFADAGGALEIVRVTFSGNVAQYGGALGLIGASATIEHSTFSGNEAWYGGAIAAYSGSTLDIVGGDLSSNEGPYSGGALYASKSDIAMNGTAFSGNQAALGYGGAIYAKEGSLALTEVEASGNYARDYGGALRAYEIAGGADLSGGSWHDNRTDGNGGAVAVTYGELRVEAVSFDENVAGFDGGAIWAGDSASLALSGASFSGNAATSGNGGAVFAGPELDGYDVTVDACTFDGNTASVAGGALAARTLGDLVVRGSWFEENVAGQGGAVHSSDARSRTVSTTTFCANSASDGGAWHASTQGAPNSWKNVVFQDNSATAGGGALWLDDDAAGEITNVTFVGNSAAEGGAIRLATSSPAIVNTIFAYTWTGDGVYAADSSSTPTFGWSAFWDNDSDDVGGTLTPAALGSTALFVDPGFVSYTDDGDCANDDLHLAGGSALIDAGAPAILDPDGGPSDVGAYGGPGAYEPDTDEPDTDTGEPDTDTGEPDTDPPDTDTGSGDTDVADTDTAPPDTDPGPAGDTDGEGVVRGKGCACSVPAAPPSGLGALLLLAVLARRRPPVSGRRSSRRCGGRTCGRTARERLRGRGRARTPAPGRAPASPRRRA